MSMDPPVAAPDLNGHQLSAYTEVKRYRTFLSIANLSTYTAGYSPACRQEGPQL